MKKLITYFIKYPITGNVLMVLILIFGTMGMMQLRKTFFPESPSRLIIVQAVYPGSSPEEIEKLIVQKIEDNVDGISGIDRVKSSSKENIGSVNIEVGRDFDPQMVLQDVKNAIDRINSFPSAMEPPAVYIRENRSLAIAFALSGDIDLQSLKHIAQTVESDLKVMEGISKVRIYGYPDEEIEIAFRENDLKKHQLTFSKVNAAIRKENVDITGGTIKTAKQDLRIRGKNKKYEADEIGEIVIAKLNNRLIRLKEVADVKQVWSDVPNRKYFNGKKSVVISIDNTIHEDVSVISDLVMDYLDDFNKQNNIVQADVIRDSSVVIIERIDLLTKNGVIGFILVLVFLTLFLHPSIAGWVAFAIPISFAGMFILAAFYGVTLNVISLFGMIIVIGILVDDGIVIAENIYQHYEKGKEPVQAAVDGTMEVLPAVFSAILTTIVAFSLFFLLDGRMGDMFPQMGFVVIATLTFSLVEGAFILPAHIAHSNALNPSKKTSLFLRIIIAGFIVLAFYILLGNSILFIQIAVGGAIALLLSFVDDYLEIPQEVANANTIDGKIPQKYSQIMLVKCTQAFDWVRVRIYEPILVFAMKSPILIIAISIGLFSITYTAIKTEIIKATVFPDIEGDYLEINLRLEAGTNEKETSQWMDYLESKVSEVNQDVKDSIQEGESIFVAVEKTIGSGSEKGRLLLMLMPMADRKITSAEITKRLKEKVGEVPGAEQLSFEAKMPFGKPVSIALYSTDNKELVDATEVLKQEMKRLGKLKNIQSSYKKGLLEVNLTLKDKAYLLGLSTSDILNEVRKGFFGLESQRLQKGTDEVKVWLRYTKEDRNSINDLETLRIRLQGKEYLLTDLVDLNIQRGVVAIEHLDGKRTVTLTADMLNPALDNPVMVVSALEKEAIPKIKRDYPSIKYSVEGSIRQQSKTGKSAKFVGPIILILMFTIIILTFRDVLQTLAVFIMIPFGLIGVGWGHFVHGDQMSMFSYFGIIALIGIMVNDSLVFISTLNLNLKRGKSFKIAIWETGVSRFRPIVLTSLTTIAGLAPLIAETSFQAQFLIPMAIAIAYGLMVATLLTLVFLPALLILFNQLRIIISWLITGEVLSAEDVEPAVKELENENLHID